jgi:hypothetical protein
MWQDLLRQGTVSELEAGRQVLADYGASLEAEAAAREKVISVLKTLLQQHVCLPFFS